MRWSGRIRMGYFPLPLSEAQRIRKFLLFPDRPSSALDPCVGDGRAFEAITNGAEVLRYGIELDAFRAEQARQRIPNIVQGNTLEVQCPVECFSVLYLNPPYDWALGRAGADVCFLTPAICPRHVQLRSAAACCRFSLKPACLPLGRVDFA